MACCRSDPLPESINVPGVVLLEEDMILSDIVGVDNAVYISRTVFKWWFGAWAFSLSMFLSLILMMMGFFGIPSISLTFFSIYFVPALIFTFLCFNRLMVYLILRTFDFWISMLLALIIMLCFGDIVAWDMRSVAGPPLIMLVAYSHLMDALPISGRYFRLFVHTANTGMWAWLLFGMMFGGIPNARDNSIAVGSEGQESMRLRVMQIFFDASIGLMLLNLRETFHAAFADKHTKLRITVPIREPPEIYRPPVPQ